MTLLGQNIDAYGRDLPGLAADGSGRRASTFTDMLRYVHDVPGIERIRFATSHPRYFTGACASPRLLFPCLSLLARSDKQPLLCSAGVATCLPKLCAFPYIPFLQQHSPHCTQTSDRPPRARVRRPAQAV